MQMEKIQFFDGIVLPTDKTRATKGAFYHALRLAMATHAHLRMIHVDPPKSEEFWHSFPRVRDTVTRWERLDHHADEKDLRRLGLGIRKVVARGDDPVEALSDEIKERQNDLLIMAPRQRTGLSSLLHKSVSNTLLQETAGPCLLVPEGVRGFINDDGVVMLGRILFPIDLTPSPKAAFDGAAWLCERLGKSQMNGTLLHVGDEGKGMPHMPESSQNWSWTQRFDKGDPAAAIIEEATRGDIDLIVMVTQGRTSLMDNVRGSVTERVIKGAPCPVLAIHE